MLEHDQGISPGVVDRLNELIEETDKDFILQLITAYLKETAPDIEDSFFALEQKKSEDLKFLVHSIKGNSANLGAGDLAGICRSIEEILPSGNWVSIESFFPSMRQEFEEFEKQLHLAQKKLREDEAIF